MGTSNIRWVPPKTNDDRYYTKEQADSLLSDKAAKVDEATDGNLASFDESGDLADSGLALDDDAGTGDAQKFWSASKTSVEIDSVRILQNMKIIFPARYSCMKTLRKRIVV